MAAFSGAISRSNAMKPILFVAFALAACSTKARDDTAQAADSIAADANATMATAVNTVDADTDRALGAAERDDGNVRAAVERAGDRSEALADNADDRASAAATGAGHKIARATHRAAAATGRALDDVGNRLQQ